MDLIGSAHYVFLCEKKKGSTFTNIARVHAMLTTFMLYEILAAWCRSVLALREQDKGREVYLFLIHLEDICGARDVTAWQQQELSSALLTCFLGEKKIEQNW